MSAARLVSKALRLVLVLAWCAGAVAGAGLSASAPEWRQVVDQLRMAKIPSEGAWFAVTYESTDTIRADALPKRYSSPRRAGTSIYALITREDFSAMHRLKTDEIWHFYKGDPIELLLLYPDGKSRVVILGSDILQGRQQPQFTVPAGTWMGARPLADTPETYALFGCTMAPGFDYTDYEPGYRDELQPAYPDRALLIAELTRAEFAQRPQAVSAAQTSGQKP